MTRFSTALLGIGVAGTLLIGSATGIALSADHGQTVAIRTSGGGPVQGSSGAMAGATPGSGGGSGGGGTTIVTTHHGGSAGGGGGGGGAAGGAPTGVANQGVNNGVIQLGSVITQTGPGRSVTMADALIAWEKYTNAHGGINGYQVSIDIRDDQGNPQLGASEYRDLNQSKHVLALVGECAPLTDEQEVGYVNQMQLPVVGECQSAPAAYSSPYIWIAGPTPTENGILGAQLMEQQQHWPTSGHQIALVCLNDPSTQQVCNGAAQQYGSGALWNGGPQMEQITDDNYPQLIAQWQSAGISHVHLVLDPGSIERYLYAAQQAGFHPAVMDNTIIDSGIGSQYPNANNMMIGTPWLPLDQNSPAMAEFKSAMATYFPDVRPDLYAETAWMGALMVQRAIAMQGSTVTRQGLINALDSIHNWNTQMGPVENFSPGMHHGPNESWLMVLQNAGTGGWYLKTDGPQLAN